jgi:hypothetical protein
MIEGYALVAAMKVPDLYVGDVRAFFAGLR